MIDIGGTSVTVHESDIDNTGGIKGGVNSLIKILKLN